MKQYFYALAIFSGTIIGVGLFGLPFVTARLGFGPTLLYFIFLGFISLLIHLIWGEIVLRTVEPHRMPGYAKIYLGERGKIISLISNAIGLYGSNLAYLIVGGGFLASVFMPIFGGNQALYSVIFFAAGSVIVFLGVKAISKSELFSLFIFFIVLIFLFLKGLPTINYDHFFTVDLKYIFLPYGVILFAISGASVIPEAREILAGKANQLKNLLVVGTIIPIITYLVFIILVVGVTGASTTEDALSGLEQVLGKNILLAGYIFGIIATFTSYITLSQVIKKIFLYDFNMPRSTSWILAMIVPISLYLLGLKDFIAVVGFVGAVTLGIDVIMTFLIYLKTKKAGQRVPEFNVSLPKSAIYCLMGLFLLGVVLTLISL